MNNTIKKDLNTSSELNAQDLFDVKNTKDRIVRVLIEKTPGRNKTFRTLKCTSKSMGNRKENNILLLKVHNFFIYNGYYSEDYFEGDVEDLRIFIDHLEENILHTKNQLKYDSNSTIYKQLLETELVQLSTSLEKCKSHLDYLIQEHNKNTI